MTPKEFENLLKDLTHLAEAEKAVYYALFVAASDEEKKKMGDFFANQRLKLQKLHQDYEAKVSSAQEKYQQTIKEILADQTPT